MRDGIGRRGLIGAAGAYFLCPARASARPQQYVSTSSPGPFVAVSPTVWWFVWRLQDCQDHDPRPWYDALAADLERQDRPASHPVVERRQAEFFARLAVTRILPFYLRYAGLGDLAVGLKFPADLMSVRQAVFDLIDAFVPVEQQESEDFGYPPEMPLRHRAAYCAALHSGSACFAAASEDRYEYAGDRCAWALISAFLDAENPVSRKEFDCSPLWDIAQSAIVRAQEFGAVEYG